VICTRADEPWQGGGRPGSDDRLLLHDVALDPPDEERAVGVQRLHLGRGDRARHALAVVVPELGDAVDLDADRRDVRSPALVDDVRLHVAPDPPHLQRERAVDLEAVLHELLVGHSRLADQQRDGLDHRRLLAMRPGHGSLMLLRAPYDRGPSSCRPTWWITRRLCGSSVSTCPFATTGRSTPSTPGRTIPSSSRCCGCPPTVR